MRAVDRFALSFAPICLRVALGVTFLWSGAGKLFSSAELTPEQVVVLERLEAQADAPPPPPPPGAIDPDAPPAEALPEPEAAPGGDRPRRDDIRSLTDPPRGSSARLHHDDPALPAGFRVTLAQDDRPRGDIDPEQTPLEDAAGEDEEPEATSAANEPQPRRLVTVALTIEAAVNPTQGSPRLPGFFAAYAIPMAWAVSIIEFLGGLCLLIGFLARFWAVMLTGVAAGIVWITSLGPAMLGGTDNPWLGFLPPLWPFDPPAVMQFLWTFGLFFMALAMIFLGAGALSIDRLLFGNPLKRYTYVRRDPSYDVQPD